MSAPYHTSHSRSSHARQCLRMLAGAALWFILTVGMAGLTGCRSPRDQVEAADRTAYAIIADVRQTAFGEAKPFTIQSPAESLRQRLIEEQGLPIGDPASLSSRHARAVPHWPEDVLVASQEPSPADSTMVEGPGQIVLSLIGALQIAARTSRDYQDSKEAMFEEALNLDLRRYDFATQYSSQGEAVLTQDESSDEPTRDVAADAGVQATRTLWNGALLSTGFTLNFLEILKGNAESSLGLRADASVTMPLLRGAGRHIAREPLTQAEREMLYAVFDYERFKREFVVDIADQYLNVLRQLDGVRNAEENYGRLRESVERSQALAEEERLPGIQVDQARQDELRARSGWISALQKLPSALDQFKITLGPAPRAALGPGSGRIGAGA